ncbi:MAG: hypothetical protein D8M53_07690 [Armatimonadetes bacterium]|nr:MAG: hypothetical protein EDM73_12675 [Armatimonadota bacterium]MBC6968359.1 hypothetical protein [Armatimonadota bacterium]MBL1150068.1 hypothetical protein [Armatimonadota bacterium]MCE7898803.1 hypothetical protein [Armatimonadetes bacterium ATM1]RIJ94156.1 MAG: hypothetical protein DCC45_13010 [Armatimonadota bacterium]
MKEPSIGRDEETHVVVSDESGIDQTIQSVCFVAGPWGAIRNLNAACKKSLADADTSEIKFKDIDDARKRRAAETGLRALLDCPHCRAMVLSWDLRDSRHQVNRRDNDSNFHRMLFHGLRSVADWFGDVEWHWYHDKSTALVQTELQAFLNNTRGYKALSGLPFDLFGNVRHTIRFTKVEQRCSKDVAVIGLADLLAGAVRHSFVDGHGCVEAYRCRGGQQGLAFEEMAQPVTASRGIIAKREMVGRIREECGRRSLGVSLESTSRLSTHKKGSKIWIWHYEPQGEYDKAPTKDRQLGTPFG